MSSDIFNDDKKVQEVVTNLKMEGVKGRYWAFIVYPSKSFLISHHLAENYISSGGLAGFGTAPDDWQSVFQALGYSLVISPLHDSDTDTSGNIKKPHYHCILTYGNTTTFKAVKGRITDYLNSPQPICLASPKSYYHYLDHSDDESIKNNKHQYDNRDIQYINCSVSDVLTLLDENAKSNILMTLTEFIKKCCIKSYDDFLFMCQDNFPEYLDFATQNTYFFNSVLRSVELERKKELKEKIISYRTDILHKVISGEISEDLAISLLKDI